MLRAFSVEVPVGVAFAKRSGMVRDGTADEFEALAGRLAVFRFDPRVPKLKQREKSVDLALFTVPAGSPTAGQAVHRSRSCSVADPLKAAIGAQRGQSQPQLIWLMSASIALA